MDNLPSTTPTQQQETVPVSETANTGAAPVTPPASSSPATAKKMRNAFILAAAAVFLLVAGVLGYVYNAFTQPSSSITPAASASPNLRFEFTPSPTPTTTATPSASATPKVSPAPTKAASPRPTTPPTSTPAPQSINLKVDPTVVRYYNDGTYAGWQQDRNYPAQNATMKKYNEFWDWYVDVCFIVTSPVDIPLSEVSYSLTADGQQTTPSNTFQNGKIQAQIPNSVCARFMKPILGTHTSVFSLTGAKITINSSTPAPITQTFTVTE